MYFVCTYGVENENRNLFVIFESFWIKIHVVFKNGIYLQMAIAHCLVANFVISEIQSRTK